MLSALGRVSEACRGGSEPSTTSLDAGQGFPNVSPTSPTSCPDSAPLGSLLPDVLVQDLLQYVWRLMADDAQSVRSVAADILTALVTLFAGQLLVGGGKNDH